MKYPTTRFVFDRKKTATKQKDAVIQVEILLDGRKKYVSTGVKVYKDQWNPKSHIVCRDDMLSLNERIDAIKSNIDNYITELVRKGESFDWDAFDRFIKCNDDSKLTFIEYMEKRISERTDISDSTRKCHRKIIASMQLYGKIVGFEQLTKSNITGYYEWLLGREIVKIDSNGKEYAAKMSVQTVASYMKILRTYIHDAILHERLDRDPSLGIKVKRGETTDARWLTEDELHRIETVELSSGSLVRVRDLFIFMCYSGLAFSDLMDFKPEKLEKEGNDTFLIGKRVKTGQEYIVLVLPKVKEILEKYDYKLPKYSNQQFNHRLKEVALEAKVHRNVASHWGRHTAAMTFLNNGVRIETVAKILGHSSIKITESVYASILKKTVVKEMKKLK